VAAASRAHGRCVKCTVVAAVVVMASPAFAQSTRHTQRSWQPQDAAYAHKGHVGPHRYGYDPDPNVRFEILRTRNWRKG
jgi:hypothetical protein